MSMVANDTEMAGKRVIITAAASGMGKAGCGVFARQGARVAAIDRDGVALAAVVEELRARGHEVKAFVADLSIEADCVEVIKAAMQWLGGVDVLWSHAGMPAPADIESMDMDQYRKSEDLNLTSAVVVTRAVLGAMRAQRSGSIVFTSSISGLVGSALSPLYSAQKFGVVGLMKGLSVRYAAEGIRVNAVCPGPVATPMLYNDFMKVDARFDPKETEARILASVPMGRFAEPEEVAEAALWLASSKAAYITGVALAVDGGLTAR